MNGRISIVPQSDEQRQALEHIRQEADGKKVRGTLTVKEGGVEAEFVPYATGQNPPTVQRKEQVGSVSVVRTSKLVKYSISLPVGMSMSIMGMTLLEQASLVVSALKDGLYERMTGERNNQNTVN